MSAGRELASRFFEEAVRPIVEDSAPGVGYLAGRLGSGSEVIGYDDETSRDHDFGCRLTLLVDDDAAALVTLVDQRLEADLPTEFAGRPVRFPTTWDQGVRHKVDIHTVHDFALSRLGFDTRTPLASAEWLCVTGQSVLEVTGGPVFHDTTQSYRPLADVLAWYPTDVWLYVIAAGWQRLSQELPLVGRAGARGDDLGSRVIAARLTRDIVHLGFLLERRWPPYPKWLGNALDELSIGPALSAQLDEVAAATDWRIRQTELGAALELIATFQSEAGLPCPRPVIEPFFDRPFTITNLAIPRELLATMTDNSLREVPLIGSIEQWSDNVDLLSSPQRRSAATVLYGFDAK